MKILAIDYGSVRTGVAISDTSNTLAFARNTLATSSTLAKDILDIAESEQVSKILLGNPIDTTGDETTSSIIVKKLVKEINNIGFSNIELVDERYTTYQASGSFRSAGISHKNQKAYIDSESARILLEHYLSTYAK